MKFYCKYFFKILSIKYSFFLYYYDHQTIEACQCDVTAPTRWRLSLSLLWLLRWHQTAELCGALHLTRNRVRISWRMSRRRRVPTRWWPWDKGWWPLLQSWQNKLSYHTHYLQYSFDVSYQNITQPNKHQHTFVHGQIMCWVVCNEQQGTVLP